MTTVMLLGSFMNLQSQCNDTIPSTGNLKQAEPTVTININNIKIANAKMIEANHLKEIVNIQDSLIKYKNDYITAQNEIIDTLQNRIIIGNEMLQEYHNQMIRQKHKNNITLGFLIGTAIAALISLFTN